MNSERSEILLDLDSSADWVLEGTKLSKSDIDFEAQQGRGEKIYFLFLLPTLCLHGDRLEGGGDVSGWFFGGPCRG